MKLRILYLTLIRKCKYYWEFSFKLQQKKKEDTILAFIELEPIFVFFNKLCYSRLLRHISLVCCIVKTGQDL